MTPEDRAILDARARRLAARPAVGEHGATPVRVLVLDVAGQRYGLPVGSLLAVVRSPAVTPLPGLPRWMLGVLHHRGHLACAIDLAGWWRGAPPVSRPFVALIEAAAGALGLFVDAIEGFRDVASADLAPSLAEPGASRFISARTLDLVQILDVEALLAAPDLRIDPPAEGPSHPRPEPPPRTAP